MNGWVTTPKPRRNYGKLLSRIPFMVRHRHVDVPGMASAVRDGRGTLALTFVHSVDLFRIRIERREGRDLKVCDVFPAGQRQQHALERRLIPSDVLHRLREFEAHRPVEDLLREDLHFRRSAQTRRP